ncbi:MAG TPA: arginase family protein [Haliangium sp.]|nr:arginase family protein [Haliangium sp.]
MNQERVYAELQAMLAPAAGGVHVVSTGLAETRALQRRIYGAAADEDVVPRWHEALRRLPGARVAVLGVPSDTGAGFTRGANRAPAILRATLVDERDHPIHDQAVIDVGDVRVVPHFLSDEMLSESQIQAARRALYGAEPRAAALPVSPLDICARVLADLRALNPDIVPVVIGGDHSVGWPAFSECLAHAERARGRRLGLLHFDAHTDLLAERLGVRYCFATWAYHANELLGRDGRLVQVGIRASGRDRAHWESTLNVRQYWPEELESRSVDAIADEIVERFRGLGVDAVYVSNDIDGTDMAYAAATGTPEPGGPAPEVVHAITRRVTGAFPMLGGDLVEVAPPLAGDRPGEPGRTLALARAYLADLIEAGLRARRA